MRKVVGWCVAVGGLVGLGAGVATRPGGAGSGGKLPYTVSRETTGIVAPLDAAGRPDYVRALNEEAGEGLPAETNGVVAWLREVGTERGHWGGDGEWKDVLRRLGVDSKDLPRKGEWDPIEVYLNGGQDMSWGDEENRLKALGRRLWKEEEDQQVAAYLKKEAGALGKLRAIAAGEGC